MGNFFLKVLPWYKLPEHTFYSGTRQQPGINQSSMDLYIETITFSSAAQAIGSLEFTVLQCKSFTLEKHYVLNLSFA